MDEVAPNVFELDMGEEIVIVSRGGRSFGKRGFVIRAVGGGLHIARLGVHRRMKLGGTKKIYAGNIRGVVVGMSANIGYWEDVDNKSIVHRVIEI
jgi:hypothetical protein